MNPKELKLIVKEKYSEIALQNSESNLLSCGCGSGCCGDTTLTFIGDDYSKLKGYNPDADLGLGCGVPTESASIKAGDTVIDLGSGAGNDCFVARSIVGESGKIIGIDMTEAMIEKARANAKKLEFHNVEFRLGDIENMPVVDNTADVVISNCVLNLVPDKKKAFSEIFRVLKPGGHLSVSDVVLRGELPAQIQQAAEMYAGCVSGAINMEDYLAIMNKQGFKNITVHKEKEISLPADLLGKYLDKNEMNDYKDKKSGIFSITVSAFKS